jgi:hypothetical protein
MHPKQPSLRHCSLRSCTVFTFIPGFVTRWSMFFLLLSLISLLFQNTAKIIKKLGIVRMSVLSGKTTFFCDFLHFLTFFFFITFPTDFPSKTHVIIFSVADNNTLSSMGRFSAHDSRPFCNVDRPRSTRLLPRHAQLQSAISPISS